MVMSGKQWECYKSVGFKRCGQLPLRGFHMKDTVQLDD